MEPVVGYHSWAIRVDQEANVHGLVSYADGRIGNVVGRDGKESSRSKVFDQRARDLSMRLHEADERVWRWDIIKHPK